MATTLAVCTKQGLRPNTTHNEEVFLREERVTVGQGTMPENLERLSGLRNPGPSDMRTVGISPIPDQVPVT